METTIELNLSADFNDLCTIYQIKPEYFIQTFIDQVSFPEYYGRPGHRDRWATLFFLEFLRTQRSHYDVNRELEQQYLRLFRDSMMDKLEAGQANTPDFIEAGRDVMLQWVKAVLEES